MIVKNWAQIISRYVLTLFFIHTTSTCIVRLGDICNALCYSNQYLLLILYLSILDFIRFAWKSVRLYITSKYEFPPFEEI